MKSTLTRLYKMFLSLKDKDARDAYVASRVATAIGIRIFNMRKKKGWTQAELAHQSGMKQARISVLEQADYENFSFSTLRRIAAAFDVAVIVDFVSYPDFLKWGDSFTADTLVPESYEESELSQAKAQAEVQDELAHMLKGLNLGQPSYDGQPSSDIQLGRKDAYDSRQRPRQPRPSFLTAA